MSERLITIRTYENPIQGEVHRVVLEQAGIHVLMDNAEISCLNGLFGAAAIGYAKLQVPEDVVEKALQILSDSENEDEESASDQDTIDEDQADSAIKCLSCGSKILDEADTCANCGWSFNEDEAEKAETEEDQTGGMNIWPILLMVAVIVGIIAFWNYYGTALGIRRGG